MPIGDHYPRGEKLAVIIVTVDTATSRIEGVGKDAAVIQISVNNKPPAFRWPKEGEAWVICRSGYEWSLESRLEDADSIALNEGEPGDLMGPDGWIPQSVLPVRVTDELPTNFEFRDENGDWNPYQAPGVAPEIEIDDAEPSDPARTVWIDTDEPGVDFNSWASLDARLDTLEAVPTWTTVSYATNWRRYQDLADNEVQVCLEPGGRFASMKGRIERHTAGFANPVTVMTLPVAFRPVRSQIVWLPHQDGVASNMLTRWIIGSSGTVTNDSGLQSQSGAVGTHIYCDGLRWPLF